MKFLPIIVATLAATSYATECEDLSTNEAKCMSSSQGNEHCSFCTSKLKNYYISLFYS
jgi:hypothetical protein